MPRRFTDVSDLDKIFALSFLMLAIIVPIIVRHVGINYGMKGLFLALFLFRYVRLIVNTISWCYAKPWPVSSNTPRPRDATVVIPTAEPGQDDVKRCIKSALNSGAIKVVVATFGLGVQQVEDFRATLEPLQQEKLVVKDTGKDQGNKRVQMMSGLKEVNTPYVVFCDDTAFWPTGPRFLRSALAPFEDPEIAGVGTNKRVVREKHTLFHPNFANFFGCLYLDRHNMETVATNRIDGGVWVISGRTCLYRSEILKNPEFERAFLNEEMDLFFWKVKIKNADDDLFISRWMATNGHKLFFQIGEDAMMHTTMNYSRDVFNDKMLRWMRGPYGRSNPRSFLEWRRIFKYPWTYYAVHIISLMNFALLWDPLLLYTLYRALPEDNTSERLPKMFCIVAWILSSKVVKLLPHLMRNPTDILLLPFYYAFAYYMSWVKAKSMATFWKTGWTLRKNVA